MEPGEQMEGVAGTVHICLLWQDMVIYKTADMFASTLIYGQA